MDSTLIVFSPLPPMENGIADYVYEQLPYHVKDFDVVVVIDNGAPEPARLPRGVTAIRLEEYRRNRSAFGGFPHVYHVGNNPDHGYMLPVLMSTPGVVVIHDLGLHHLVDSQTLMRGNTAGYAWALWQQHGRLGKLLGDQFLRFGWKGQLVQHELPLNGAVIDAAAHIIVHSGYSADAIARERPDKPVTVIPHHLSPRIQRYNRARRPEYRRELGLPAEGVLITSLGFISRAKQIPAVLETLAALKKEGLRFTYVLAGKCRPDEYDVFKDIELLELQENVIVTGFLDEDAFFRHVAAADIILNLRYPSGGETSGTLTRALGMGRCCVVVNIGAFAEIPGNCVVKLGWGERFEADLHETIRRLVSRPAERARYEMAARQWIGERQRIPDTVGRYHDVIRSIGAPASMASELLGIPGVRQAGFLSARVVERFMSENADRLDKVVETGGGHLWWREALLPRGGDGVPLGTVTEGEGALKVLRDLYGYDEEAITPLGDDSLNGQDLRPEERRRFQRILVVQPLSRWADDPATRLTQLNWLLDFGAEAVLCLEYDIEQPTRLPMSRAAWRDYIEAAGFAIVEGAEAPSDVTFSALESTPVEWAYRLRKLSERVERFPQPHYQGQDACRLLLAPGARLAPMPVREMETEADKESARRAG